MERPKVIFVAGLDLSGSTIFDMALGSIANIAGLGEADNILDPHKRAEGESQNGPISKQTCTCGAQGSSCPIWGPTLQFIEDHPESTFAERYSRLLKSASDHTGARNFVDSSKQISAIKHHVRAASELYMSRDLVAILIYRGPVDWLMSDRRRAQRRSQKRTFAISRRRLLKWNKRYIELRKYLSDNDIPFTMVSLRDFQASPRIVFRALENVGLRPLEGAGDVDISMSKSHVLWGSHHRLTERSHTISRQPASSFLDSLIALSVTLSVPRSLRTHMSFSLQIAKSIR